MTQCFCNTFLVNGTVKSPKVLAGVGVEKKNMSYTLSVLETFYVQLEKAKVIKTIKYRKFLTVAL